MAPKQTQRTQVLFQVDLNISLQHSQFSRASLLPFKMFTSHHEGMNLRPPKREGYRSSAAGLAKQYKTKEKGCKKCIRMLSQGKSSSRVSRCFCN